MISPEQVHYGINIGLHSWILFTFLTILFFTFISRKEEHTITHELNSSINKSIPAILNKLDSNIDTKIDWKKVYDKVEKLKTRDDGNSPDIKKHNSNLLKTTIAISCSILLVIIAIIIYFTYYKQYDIKLKSIIIENLSVFLFIGIIELLFFIKIAFNYTPVTTTDMVNQLADRSAYNINQELD